MASITDFAVVYDITCNKERSKIDKLLKGFGFRVQKSVFECRLSKREYCELLKKIEALNIQTGFVKIYRLIYSKHLCLGEKSPNNRDKEVAYII